MLDVSKTTKPKSDQLNYDDLIGGKKMVIKVTKVSIMGEADQPIAINFEGDNGKPYKPCKSMRRVLVNIWGSDGNQYAGRRMTLFGDPNVVFGGAKVGGIRISHLSDMTAPVTMALTATRASRKPYTVQPLIDKVDVPKYNSDQKEISYNHVSVQDHDDSPDTVIHQDAPDMPDILSQAFMEAKKGSDAFKSWVDQRSESEKELLRKNSKELSQQAKMADLNNNNTPPV